MALDFPNNPSDGQVYGNFYYLASKGIWKSLSAGASPSILTNPTINTPTINNAVIGATATNATTVPVIVRGAASQTANLQEWRNSAGVVLADVDNVGNIQAVKVGLGGTNPSTLPSNINLQVTGRAKILSSGSESAGIWLTGSNNVDTAFIGQTSATTTDPVGIYHNGAWRFQVDSAGRVTTPFQPSFYAYGSGTVVMSGTQRDELIPFGTAETNIGGNFNTSNSRFTAPVSGTYYFWMQSCTTDATSTGPEIYIIKNGSALNNVAISYNSAFYNTFGGSYILYLNQNDYVQMAVRNNNGTTFTIERGRSRFAGYLMG
jgi:hypothetical protein